MEYKGVLCKNEIIENKFMQGFTQQGLILEK